MVPLEVPFDDVVENLLWVDVAVDGFFFVHLVLNFFVGFFDKKQVWELACILLQMP